MPLEDKDKQQQPANIPGTKSPSATRRKLLKASAMAPLLATLQPGAAMAASSAMQCKGGDFSNKKFVENGNSINGDSAVRVAVDYYERHTNNSDLNLPRKLYLIDESLYAQNGDSHQVSQDALNDYYDHTTAYVLEVYEYGEDYFGRLGPWPKFQLVDGSTSALSKSCETSLIGAGYNI